jgi:hypothetical protein
METRFPVLGFRFGGVGTAARPKQRLSCPLVIDVLEINLDPRLRRTHCLTLRKAPIWSPGLITSLLQFRTREETFMNAFRLTFVGATLAVAVTALSGVAEAAPRVKCDDTGRDPGLREECVSPTFPSFDRGPCSKGACYRSATRHKHKKPKS